jgi:hypothetical protein
MLAHGELGDDVNRAAAAKLARFLESNWCEEFSESLSEQHDAAVGFALARAVHKGWVVASDAIDPNVQAAEEFMSLLGNDA